MDCQNAVFRCSSYVALPAIIPHGRGDGERLIYGGGGDVGHSVSQLAKVQTFSSNGVNAHKVGAIVTLCAAASYKISDAWGSTTICTLPWTPRNVVSTAFAVQGGGSGVVLRVEKNGDVKVVGVNTTWRSGWLFGTLSFAVME